MCDEHFEVPNTKKYSEFQKPVEENDYIPILPDSELKQEIISPHHSIRPQELTSIFRQFVTRSNLLNLVEFGQNDLVNIDKFNQIVDECIVIFQNALNYHLFKNPDAPKYIMCPNINACTFRLGRKQLLRLKRSFGSSALQWEILLEISIKNKSTNYVLKLIIDDYDGKYEIVSIDMLGTNVNENYVLLDEKYQKKCFGSTELNQIECESPINKYGQGKNRGIWDRVCIKDTDCPFYKANKNYPNEFGGCVEGMCEMPIGVRQISPQLYDVNTHPYCHGDCCKNQTVPDYAFEGDIYVRKRHEKILRKKGLPIF